MSLQGSNEQKLTALYLLLILSPRHFFPNFPPPPSSTVDVPSTWLAQHLPTTVNFLLLNPIKGKLLIPKRMVST